MTRPKLMKARASRPRRETSWRIANRLPISDLPGASCGMVGVHLDVSSAILLASLGVRIGIHGVVGTISHRPHAGGGIAVLLRQILFDRIGALFGKVHVVNSRSNGVGVAL